jgi:transcriptional antiterminator NusG
MIEEIEKEVATQEVEEPEIEAVAPEEVSDEVSVEAEAEVSEEVSVDVSVEVTEEILDDVSGEVAEALIDEVVEEVETDFPEQDVEAASEEQLDESEAGSSTDGDDAVPAEVVVLPDDGRAWYVVHCYSGYENKVRHSIEQRIETMGMQSQIFDVVVPTEEEIEIKDGKRRTVERRVFPGYILVQLIMDEDSWYVVRNTPGVTGFVGMGNEPTPLREDEVAKIMNRMEAEAPKVKFNFQPGEKVRIRTGPFADFIGTVDEIDIERAKVRVLVSFFGRETPVELDFLHVENI